MRVFCLAFVRVSNLEEAANAEAEGTRCLSSLHRRQDWRGTLRLARRHNYCTQNEAIEARDETKGANEAIGLSNHPLVAM